MDTTTSLRYYLIKEQGKKGLVMTRGLPVQEARKVIGRHFLKLIEHPHKMARIAAREIPERFSLGAKFVATQSFTVGLIMKYRGKNEIEVLWITTSKEKKRVVHTDR